MYSGFELCENEAASDDNEEYAHSEKYEIPRRDWDAPDSIASYLALLNDIRRRHPALGDLHSLRLHAATDDAFLVFSKQLDGDTVLVVVNVDPLAPRQTMLELDLPALGLPWDATMTAFDEISGETFFWQGAEQYVRLTPPNPAHIIDLRPQA